MLNGLDLFSGIGGITYGLRGYVQPLCYCENDRYAQSVLLSRMRDHLLPRAPIWDDVRTFPAAEVLGQVDIIYGGFPCQDISIAGNGKGLEGERSGLYFEVLRLVEYLKPKFIFLENVPAIRTRGLPRVIKTISDCGYDLRWGVVSAKAVGAPHLRKRWFALAHRRCERRQQESLGALANESPDEGRDSKKDNEPKRMVQGDFWPPLNLKICGMDDGLSGRMERVKCLGNAVVPIQARKAFEELMGLSDNLE